MEHLRSVTRLPRSVDDLRGLRAARWIRESTRGQFDRFGPEAQRDQQDRAIDRLGMIDTGISWTVAHSGRTVEATPEWAEMVDAAGRAYDVLVVGYVSRFSRSVEVHYAVRRTMHEAGAVVLFADERILTSDLDRWEEWHREIGEAEAYSRRLGRRIREGYAAKFAPRSQTGDQAGNAPFGFRRTGERHVLEVDPETIGMAVHVFERYASGGMSHEDIAAETGLASGAIRAMLANPIYSGSIRRHRRSPDEETRAAAWAAEPPVSAELWARVQEVRSLRYRGGGGPAKRFHLLSRRLWCVCGRAIKADVVTGQAKTYRRYRHMQPCEAWSTASVSAATFEVSITDQLDRISLKPAVLDRIRAVVSSKAPSATPLRRRQLERELADRATEHARRRLTTDAYLAEHVRLTADLDALERSTEPAGITPERAVELLRNLALAWRKAGEEERQELVRQVYQRIEVTGDQLVGMELTPLAYRWGLDQAIPDYVATLARARPASAGRSVAKVRVVIVGRRERARMVRSA